MNEQKPNYAYTKQREAFTYGVHYKIKELLGIHEIIIIKLVDDLNLKYSFWENKIKLNEKLQEPIKLINDLLDNDIKISKDSIFSRYQKQLNISDLTIVKVIRK